MIELLWLLLPVAAASGWWVAKRTERRAAAERPGTLPGDYIRGLNFLLNEQADKALEVFIQMVDVDSETVETHLILGSLFRRRGEVDRAIRIHQNLIARPSLEPAQKLNALLELGRDYLKAGLFDRAEGLFRELKASGTRAPEVYLHLRDLYEREKEWDRAIEAAEQLQASSQEPQHPIIAHYYCELAEAALRRGESAKAAQLAKRALGQDRSCVRASILLGDIGAARGDYRDAIKNYRRALAQDPDFLPVILPKLRAAYARLRGAGVYVGFLRELHARERSTATTLALVEALQEEGGRGEAELLLAEALKQERPPLVLLREFVRLEVDEVAEPGRRVLQQVDRALGGFVSDWLVYRCTRCGFEAKGLLWQCPSCHGWGLMRPLDRLAEPAHTKPGQASVL